MTSLLTHSLKRLGALLDFHDVPADQLATVSLRTLQMISGLSAAHIGFKVYGKEHVPLPWYFGDVANFGMATFTGVAFLMVELCSLYSMSARRRPWQQGLGLVTYVLLMIANYIIHRSYYANADLPFVNEGLAALVALGGIGVGLQYTAALAYDRQEALLRAQEAEQKQRVAEALAENERRRREAQERQAAELARQQAAAEATRQREDERVRREAELERERMTLQTQVRLAQIQAEKEAQVARAEAEAAAQRELEAERARLAAATEQARIATEAGVRRTEAQVEQKRIAAEQRKAELQQQQAEAERARAEAQRLAAEAERQRAGEQARLAEAERRRAEAEARGEFPCTYPGCTFVGTSQNALNAHARSHRQSLVTAEPAVLGSNGHLAEAYG